MASHMSVLRLCWNMQDGSRERSWVVLEELGWGIGQAEAMMGMGEGRSLWLWHTMKPCPLSQPSPAPQCSSYLHHLDILHSLKENHWHVGSILGSEFDAVHILLVPQHHQSKLGMIGLRLK